MQVAVTLKSCTAAGWGARIAGATGVVIGGFWFFAWSVGLAQRLAASTIIMKTNAALGIALAGMALLLLLPIASSPVRRGAGIACAAVALLIGSITLSEHLFHYNSGIDQLLFKEAPGALATTSPNRMGLPASTSLTLLGLGLLALAGRKRVFAPYFGVGVCLINLVPAVGYLYKIDVFYGMPLMGIAWPTVAALILLGIGLVLGNEEHGSVALLLREDAGGELLRRLWPAAVLLLLVLGFLGVNGQRHGLFDMEVGTGLLIVALVLVFSIGLFMSAARLSRLALKQADGEQALRQSRERLAGIVESAMDAIITVDEHQRIMLFNTSAEKVFLCPASDAIGKPLERFIPERFRRLHREHVRQFGETGTTNRSMQKPGVLYALRSDGQEFPIEASISQVQAGGQKLYTVILRDITYRKQTEEALIRSEKLASVGQLAATIAHEINNPLTAVTNTLYLVRHDDRIAAESQHYLQLAEAELQRAGHIIHGALGLSKQAALPDKFRPAEVVEGVLALLERKLKDKATTVQKTYLAETEIVGFASEIRQVVVNLISNAIDAISEQGHIALRVSDSRDWRQPAMRGARITIVDDGCGIPRGPLQHIFEPFFTTKRTGTGLGLWVCNEIIQKHGGSIRVRSRCGGSQQHGTVFSIFLPAGGIGSAAATMEQPGHCQPVA